MKRTSAAPRTGPRAPWLLLACTLVLAVCGYLLLTNQPPPAPTGDQPATRPGPHGTPVPRPPADATARTRGPNPDTSTSPAPAPTPSASRSRSAAAMLPPRGEGPAANHQIQRLIEEAWPADLPAPLEEHLRRDGAALLRADATGIGRDRFPAVFGQQPDQAVAPAFSRLRIQAAIARKDTRAGRAVVHLVWAAADRGGTYTDGRISDFTFRRPKGDGPWTPLPRT
ncbi:hypothetical protein [Streptomyces sp. NPDC046925]|uniref:hypothetical protein n=1 Tax=Streptomyces sp. NPDC046925 TaxID=3155375 RepID=UPI0033E51311